MSPVFAYCRISKTDQTTENQLQEIPAQSNAVVPSARA